MKNVIWQMENDPLSSISDPLSLYILRLFPQLLDFSFDLDSRVADCKLRRFREDRVSLAIDLLQEKIELLADLRVAREQLLRLRQVALQARDLFRDVAAFGQMSDLLGQPRLVNGSLFDQLLDAATQFVAVSVYDSGGVRFDDGDVIFDAFDASQHLLLQLVPLDRAHRDQRRQRLRQRRFDAFDDRAAQRAAGGGGSQDVWQPSERRQIGLAHKPELFTHHAQRFQVAANQRAVEFKGDVGDLSEIDSHIDATARDRGLNHFFERDF